MTGEMSSVNPALVGSKGNAPFGAVSRKAVDVTQFEPPLTEVLEPAGNAGAVTISNVSEKVVTGRPVDKVIARVPRLVARSCSCKVAVTGAPHEPAAVKLKACVTVAPPPMSAPYVCGALGNSTLPFACK